MKQCTYTIESGKLVCNYETYKGHKGVKIFELSRKQYDEVLGKWWFSFREPGTKYAITSVGWCNLSKCYSALYNNTQLSGFINCDLSVLIN